MSDSKQSFREWEAEYERRLAFLRGKYVIFRIYPATTTLGEVINSLAASLPRTPIEFALTRMGMTPSDNRSVFEDDPLYQRISL